VGGGVEDLGGALLAEMAEPLVQVHLDTLLSIYPRDVTLQFMRFPLEGRELSLPSAVAAECAGAQGSSYEMFREIFAQFDSLGTTPWTEIASRAGVPDPNAFADCIRLPADSFPRIADGEEAWLGQRCGRHSNTMDQRAAVLRSHDG